MNKKISQFELTTKLQEQDLITLVQDGSNKNITSGSFTTSLSGTFATNERVDAVEEDVEILDTKVDDNYKDLSNKIIEGDTSVTTNLNSTITSYYDVLNNKIITLDTKHDTDMSEIGGTMQEWIDDIDNRSTLQQLQDALNRLTVAENTITALAEVIANGGGSGGDVPGYHTQPSSTITSLQGYYKGISADPLVSTDTLNQALSKLENQVEAVADGSGSLPVIKMGESTTPTDNYIYTAGKVRQDYVFKSGDTVPGRIVYTTGIQGGQTFRSGWDGVGASLYPTNSKWNLELDNLFVRGNMTVNQLTINEIKAVGGDILVTVADMKCTNVENLDSGYKCYFDTEDGTKYNSFIVNDQAICQKFDGKNVKRYWRKVDEVGRDYILLSKDVCESGSGTPSADDEILLLGHRVEGDAEYDKQMEDRRNAIFISAKGANAPRIAFYGNITDFTLEDKERTVIGKDSKFVGTITVMGEDGSLNSIPLYRGMWSGEKQYYYYDYVTYKGSTWIATQNNINEEPKEGSKYWSLYVAKGEDGKSGDDVAKWVEIIGERLFLYDTPDFTGDPTPRNLLLTANTYGITNPSYQWTDSSNQVLGYGNTLTVLPNMLKNRTGIFRCTVTDTITTGKYYDETQIAKLSNGTEGLDAYYIDLTNYSVSVPVSSTGEMLVDPDSVFTDVFAYHGVNKISIENLEVSFMDGSGKCVIDGNRIILKSLGSRYAKIKIIVTVEQGIQVEKFWYINQNKDGENGFNGEDAVRTYLSGDQFFHYAQYATVPSPEVITLRMDTSLTGNVTYKWYWAIAGTSDYNLLEGETRSELLVHYNGIYFTSTGADEITFRCLVTSEGGNTFEDIITINKVRDGESAYHCTLDNQNITVEATNEGVVGDWSQASTYATLRRGSKFIDNTEYTITATQLTPNVGTLSINQEKKQITVNRSSIPNNYITVQWQIDFTHEGAIRDSIVLSLVKNIAGKDGLLGNSSIQIYCNTNNTPPTPDFTDMIPAAGKPSGGYTWTPDPVNSTTELTWTSTGYYNPNTGKIDTLPESITGQRWTKPVVFSPLNGVNGLPGDDGVGIESVVMQYYKSTSPTSQNDGSWSYTSPGAETGYWIWTRLEITYTDGSYAYTAAVCTTGATGDTGPGLSYRGEYNSDTTYGWTTMANGNIRDVVSIDINNTVTYYMVNSSKKGKTFKGQNPATTSGSDGNSSYYWVKMNSFDNIATGLLFAEKATIASWDFYNQYIASQSDTMRLDGNSNPLSNIHLAIGNKAVSEPGNAAFRVDKTGAVRASNVTVNGNFSIDAGDSMTSTTYGPAQLYFMRNSNTASNPRISHAAIGWTYGSDSVYTSVIGASTPDQRNAGYFKGTGGTPVLQVDGNSTTPAISTKSSIYINHADGGSLAGLVLNGTNSTWQAAQIKFTNEYYGTTGASRPKTWRIETGGSNVYNGDLCIYAENYAGSTSYMARFKTGGGLNVPGGVDESSDIRKKNRKANVPNILSKIQNIDAFYFTWKTDEEEKIHMGISAQDVLDEFPEVVSTTTLDDNETEYSVNYANLATVIAINGLKELHEIVKQQNDRITELENKLKQYG